MRVQQAATGDSEGRLEEKSSHFGVRDFAFIQAASAGVCLRVSSHGRHAVDSLEPTAVPMPRARELLGDKSYSEIYEAIDEGKLVALKDGRKTLITLDSIRSYMAALPLGPVRALAPRRAKRTRPAGSQRSTGPADTTDHPLATP